MVTATTFETHFENRFKQKTNCKDGLRGTNTNAKNNLSRLILETTRTLNWNNRSVTTNVKNKLKRKTVHFYYQFFFDNVPLQK